MTTKTGFTFYNFANEQSLFQSLVTESIQATGVDMYYLPRRRLDFDPIYGADALSHFDTAYLLEFYTESYMGFSGENSIFTKFGLEIRDQIFFSCAYDRFNSVVGTPENLPRPMEGDLIYFPLNKKCFVIRYVDNKPTFYALGILPQYRLTCELFEYSSEKFTTGIAAIDNLFIGLSQDVYNWAYTDNDGTPFTDESGNVLLIENYHMDIIDVTADNDDLTKEADQFISWSEQNPFGEIANTFPAGNTSSEYYKKFANNDPLSEFFSIK